MKDHEFYGTTTLGEKGQVVIPVQARGSLKLKKGEKLLVFSFGRDMLAFAKLAQVEQFAHNMEKRLQGIRSILKKQRRQRNSYGQ